MGCRQTRLAAPEAWLDVVKGHKSTLKRHSTETASFSSQLSDLSELSLLIAGNRMIECNNFASRPYTPTSTGSTEVALAMSWH